MIAVQYAHKIKEEHLARKAVIYLRQSSEKQVLENKESQRLQYAMVDRARALGWKVVEVIDSDLGSSATIGAPEREGFQRLIASVALGEVGVVFSRELSRLLRTDKDFCSWWRSARSLGHSSGTRSRSTTQTSSTTNWCWGSRAP